MTQDEIDKLRKDTNDCTKPIPSLIEGKDATYDLLMDIYNNPEKHDISESEISTIKKAIDNSKKIFAKFPEIELALQYLNTCYASTGIHAGGVIISGKPLACNCPMIAGSDTAVLPLVQIEMKDLDFYKLLNTMGNVKSGNMLGRA